MVDLQLIFSKGVGCPTVEQESVEQPLVSKNVGGGHWQQRSSHSVATSLFRLLRIKPGVPVVHCYLAPVRSTKLFCCCQLTRLEDYDDDDDDFDGGEVKEKNCAHFQRNVGWMFIWFYLLGFLQWYHHHRDNDDVLKRWLRQRSKETTQSLPQQVWQGYISNLAPTTWPQHQVRNCLESAFYLPALESSIPELVT